MCEGSQDLWGSIVYQVAVIRHCKAAVTAGAAVMKLMFPVTLKNPALWFFSRIFLAVACAGSACFPGCCCGSMSRIKCWSSGSHFLVVQDTVYVSHLQHLTSCPSQCLPFEPALWINILYTANGSFFCKNWIIKQCSYCGCYKAHVECIICIFAPVNYFQWTWCISTKQIELNPFLLL